MTKLALAPEDFPTPPRGPLHVRLIRSLLKLPLGRGLQLDMRAALIRIAYANEAKQVGADRGRIEGSRIFEQGTVEEEREEWLTILLTRKARSLRVPVPPIKFDDITHEVLEPWEHGSRTGAYYLSETGYKALRDAIREERASRRLARAHMINWLSAWTALLTAVAAILSAWVAVLALTR